MKRHLPEVSDAAPEGEETPQPDVEDQDATKESKGNKAVGLSYVNLLVYKFCCLNLASINS